VIGSGAGGAATAQVLTRNGKKVLIIEAGANYFEGLDDPNPQNLKTYFSNDEIKLRRRRLIEPDPEMEPRTFRASEQDGKRHFIGEVNPLPKTVGGGAVHADLKAPRFMRQDFQLAHLAKKFDGTSFENWPITYEQLEPFYYFFEKAIGVQGVANSNPFEEKRTTEFPMPPGAPMYVGLRVGAAAKKLGYNPFPYPTAVNSQPYDGRPACVDCGMCSGYGCPNSSKGAPPVTTLRKALLTGNALLLCETRVIRLQRTGTKITGVVCLDPQGKQVEYTADMFFLAASPIESARLLFLSDKGGAGLGNSSGLVGRNLMFHYQTYTIGIFEDRIHSHRGRSVSHGILDFRGNANDVENHPLGGIVEIAGAGDVIEEALEYGLRMGHHGSFLKSLMQQSPFRDRLAALIMQGEDAPQASNRIDLDPNVKDLDGLPVPRITYRNHKFETSAQHFYSPKLKKILHEAGAKYVFVAPQEQVPHTGHIMGTMRFGTDAKRSVCGANGKFHDLDNLYSTDGALFPTSSGLNPTMTIIAVAGYVAAAAIYPQQPERGIA
jgi:gluconate 2-dehydrogenase alpha chain